MARHLDVGKQGEDFCVKHYVKRGFKILEQNYWKKWGEIDVIAEKNNVLHFIEVKSVSYETDFNNYIPEENIRKFKKQRLKRVINTYLAEKKVSSETQNGELEFQIDVVAIFLSPKIGESKIRVTENIIL